LNSITNNLGVAGTLITNSTWYSTLGIMRAYYWTNSAMTTVYAKFAADVGETSLHLIQLTNSATSSIFSGVVANSVASVYGFTNIISSSANSIVFTFSAIGDGSVTPTAGSGMTMRSVRSVGATAHTAAVASNPGASSTTNKITWNESYPNGAIAFSVKGYD
jgi:hypothetical protein